MKVSTNFVVPRHRWALPLAGSIASLAAVAIALVVWFAMDSVSRRREIPELEERLATLSQRVVAHPVVSLPSNVELSELRRRVAALNSLAPQRGAPLTQILARLETLLPDSMWLASLHHRAREGELVIVVESGSAEPFAQFLRKLEQDPLFEGILLSKQTPQESSGRGVLQSELRLRR